MFTIYSLYIDFIITIYSLCNPFTWFIPLLQHGSDLSTFPQRVSYCIHYMFTICSLYIDFRITICSLYVHYVTHSHRSSLYYNMDLIYLHFLREFLTVFTVLSQYVHYMFTICSLYIDFIITICSLYVHYILTLESLYVHYIFTICSLYTHYILTL